MRTRQTNRVVTGVGVVLLAAIVIGSFVATGWFAGTGGFFGRDSAGGLGGSAGLAGGAQGESGATPENPVVLIHDSEGNVHSMPLLEDGQLRVSTELGTNVITVEGGQAFVSESDCDGHDCMRQGRIAGPTSQIICLPHQLWVEVRTDSSAGQMDVDSAANGGGHAAGVDGGSGAEDSADGSGGSAGGALDDSTASTPDDPSSFDDLDTTSR